MTPAKVARSIQIGMVALATVLAAVLMSPFAKSFFLAAVLAGVLHRSYSSLEKRLKGRRQLAAALMTTAVFLLLIVPLGALTTVIIREAIDGVRFVRGVLAEGEVDRLILYLPVFLQGPATEFAAETLDHVGEAVTAAQAGKAAAVLGGLFSLISSVFLQTVLMLIALYFFLYEGRRLVRWLVRVSPLPADQLQQLLAEFRTVSRAVLASSLATAAVQAVVALVGFLVTRVPHPIFFTVVTFVAAFIPFGGPAIIGVCLAALLFATGHPWAAGFLVLWSLTAVSLVDNIVKPLVMKSEVDLHSAVVFFAFLGGLTVFGPIGLLLGPLIVSFFLAMLRMNRGMLAEAARQG